MIRSDFASVVATTQPHPPVAVMLGWETLDFDAEIGSIRGRMLARPDFLNANGVVQGGVLSSMLDSAAALAVMCSSDDATFASTLELKSSFFRPVGAGPIIGEGIVISRTSGICFVEAKLLSVGGHLIAKASATMRLLQVPNRNSAKKQANGNA